MAAGCQGAAPSSSSPTGAPWNARMGALPALGSRSARRVADLRNADGSLGSPGLHPTLPDASVQDVRGPTPAGAGSLDPKGAAAARTGAVLSMSAAHPAPKPLNLHSRKMLIQSYTRTQKGTPDHPFGGCRTLLEHTQLVLHPLEVPCSGWISRPATGSPGEVK